MLNFASTVSIWASYFAIASLLVQRHIEVRQQFISNLHPAFPLALASESRRKNLNKIYSSLPVCNVQKLLDKNFVSKNWQN